MRAAGAGEHFSRRKRERKTAICRDAHMQCNPGRRIASPLKRGPARPPACASAPRAPHPASGERLGGRRGTREGVGAVRVASAGYREGARAPQRIASDRRHRRRAMTPAAASEGSTEDAQARMHADARCTNGLGRPGTVQRNLRDARERTRRDARYRLWRWFHGREYAFGPFVMRDSVSTGRCSSTVDEARRDAARRCPETTTGVIPVAARSPLAARAHAPGAAGADVRRAGSAARCSPSPTNLPRRGMGSGVPIRRVCARAQHAEAGAPPHREHINRLIGAAAGEGLRSAAARESSPGHGVRP